MLHEIKVKRWWSTYTATNERIAKVTLYCVPKVSAGPSLHVATARAHKDGWKRYTVNTGGGISICAYYGDNRAKAIARLVYELSLWRKSLKQNEPHA